MRSEEKEAWIRVSVRQADRALAKFETAGFRLVRYESSSQVESRGSNGHGGCKSCSLQSILAGWESRISLLVTAMDSKTNYIVDDDDMAAAEDAVNVVFGAKENSPGGDHSYRQILEELTVGPLLPTEDAGTGPFLQAEVLASVAARRIQNIIVTTSTKLHANDRVNHGLAVSPDALPDIDALLAPIGEMAWACNCTARVLNYAITFRTSDPPEDDCTRPTTSSTPSSSFSLVSPFSFLFGTLSNLASKTKQH